MKGNDWVFMIKAMRYNEKEIYLHGATAAKVVAGVPGKNCNNNCPLTFNSE